MCIPKKRLLPLTATDGQILAFNAAKGRWEAADNTVGGGPGFNPATDQNITGNYQFAKPLQMAVYADEVTAPEGGMAYYTPAPSVEGKYLEAIDSSIYYDYSAVTHSRTITVPDASGTLAYTSNLTNSVKLSAPLDGTRRNLVDYAGNNLPIKVSNTLVSIDSLLVPYGGNPTGMDLTVTAKASVGTLHFGSSISYYINENEFAAPTKDYVLTAKSYRFNFDTPASGGMGIGAAPITGSKVKIQGGTSQSSLLLSNSAATATNEFDGNGKFTSTFTGKTENQSFNGITLVNSTPALLGKQQYTPSIIIGGNGFKVDGSENQAMTFKMEGIPIQAPTLQALITSKFTFSANVNGGAYTEILDIRNTGVNNILMGAFSTIGTASQGIGFSNTCVNATALAIGNTNVSGGAIFEVASTTKGFLLPRMSTANKTAIAGAAAGLMLFDADLDKPAIRTSAGWKTFVLE